MTVSTQTAGLMEITRLVPLVFHRLRAFGDAFHKEHGITTPMRGVMLSLFDRGAQTVPHLAAARPVSRQHIQTIVDALTDRGLVLIKPNPVHKRSSLVDLSEDGYELFAKVREDEMTVFSDAFADFGIDDLRATQHVLTNLSSQLETLINSQKETNDDA
ncbi:MAG: MarR family transcriptional regulator [Planctomycetaceae bacterium]|nr:MarR family transcriptional regulator [Planctomycetaceae bacterium]